MSYVLLCVGFLVAATAVALIVRRPDRMSRPAALVAGAAALVLLTAVFDNVMIAVGLFDYSSAHISGIRIGDAPIEDFAYPLAAVILLPALWSRLRRDRRHERGPR